MIVLFADLLGFFHHATSAPTVGLTLTFVGVPSLFKRALPCLDVQFLIALKSPLLGLPILLADLEDLELALGRLEQRGFESLAFLVSEFELLVGEAFSSDTELLFLENCE